MGGRLPVLVVVAACTAFVAATLIRSPSFVYSTRLRPGNDKAEAQMPAEKPQRKGAAEAARPPGEIRLSDIETAGIAVAAAQGGTVAHRMRSRERSSLTPIASPMLRSGWRATLREADQRTYSTCSDV